MRSSGSRNGKATRVHQARCGSPQHPMHIRGHGLKPHPGSEEKLPTLEEEVATEVPEDKDTSQAKGKRETEEQRAKAQG